MKINTIIKHGLESKAEELRDNGLRLNDIAIQLSKEADLTITKSSLQRYFRSKQQDTQRLIEQKDALKATVIEAEINTVAKRQKLIHKLEKLADAAIEQGDLKVAVDALKEATSTLNSLDKGLGKYETTPAVQVNLQQGNIDAEKQALLGTISYKRRILNPVAYYWCMQQHIGLKKMFAKTDSGYPRFLVLGWCSHSERDRYVQS